MLEPIGDMQSYHNFSDRNVISFDLCELRASLRARTIYKIQIEARKHEENMDPQRLNEQLQKLLVDLIAYQEATYKECRFIDFYSNNHQEILVEIANTILQEFQNIFGGVIPQLKKIIRDSLCDCLKTLEREFKAYFRVILKKDKNIRSYGEACSSCESYLINMMKEYTFKKLKCIPSDVLFLEYEFSTTINRNVQEIIIIKGLSKSLWQNNGILRDPISKNFNSIFQDYFAGNEVFKIFDEELLGGRDNVVTLFNIVLLTKYQTESENRQLKYEYILQQICEMFMLEYAKQCPELEDTINLVISKKNSKQKDSQIVEALAFYKKKWESSIENHTNLTAMAYLFLAFHFVSNEGLFQSYTASKRYMLKCILQNLKNGDFQFTNFQILCCMESTLMNQAKDIVTISDQNLKIESFLLNIRQNVSDNFKTKKNFATPETSDSFEDTYDISADYSRRSDSSEDILEDEKTSNIKTFMLENFSFERISGSKTKSKVINICISDKSFENLFKLRDWKIISQMFQNSEAFVLNWGSNSTGETIQTIVSTMRKHVKQKNQRLSDQTFVLSWMEIFAKKGINIYQLVKEMKNESWNKIYEEATAMGVYLAHILTKAEPFKGCVINFAGFGFGTVVIMKCLKELINICQNDIIYDVFLMGGVIDVKDFNKEISGIIANKIINCYSKHDYIIGFILKMINPSGFPIGVCPIPISAKNIRNFDVTDWVSEAIDYREALYNILALSDFNEDLESIISYKA